MNNRVYCMKKIMIFLLVFLMLNGIQPAAGEEPGSLFERQESGFAFFRKMLGGPYYLCDEPERYYWVNGVIGAWDNDPNPMIEAEAVWKSGDEWLKEAVGVEYDGNGWFWFSPENVSQPGTAVFTLRMTWKNYQLIDDVTLRVLRLPFNTYKKTAGEIVLGEDYRFGSPVHLEELLDSCWKISVEMEHGPYDGWDDYPSLQIPDDENRDDYNNYNDAYGDDFIGFDSETGNLTVLQPGMYQYTVRRRIDNVWFDFPVRIIARGSGVPGESGDYQYRLYEDGTVDITAYTGSEREVRIPEEMDGHPVFCLAGNAFGDNRMLSRVTVPGCVKVIDRQAFRNCYALEEIILEEGVLSIGKEALSGCGILKKIRIPASVDYIGPQPVFSCPELAEIAVDEGNARYAVYKHLLYDKTERKIIQALSRQITGSFEIPQGTRIIGESAFSECEYLKSIVIPDSVEEIEGYAFGGYSHLEELTLPEGVRILGGNILDGCESIRKLTIPASVKWIDDNTLAGCSKDMAIELYSKEIELYCADHGFLNLVRK